MMRAFDFALEEYPSSSIERAFKEWMRTKSVMPTPADIAALMTLDKPVRRGPEADITALTPREREEELDRRANRGVPWSMKKWSEFTDDDQRKLAVHMFEMGEEKALTYEIFLRDWVGAPRGVLGLLGVSFETQESL